VNLINTIPLSIIQSNSSRGHDFLLYTHLKLPDRSIFFITTVQFLGEDNSQVHFKLIIAGDNVGYAFDLNDTHEGAQDNLHAS
jgi:hypothetical protein